MGRLVTKLSIYESNITSEDQTTKQTVAASTENEEIKTVDVLDAEIGQPEVNCLKQDEKIDSGLGNAFDGVEANSSECNTKVLNVEVKGNVPACPLAQPFFDLSPHQNDTEESKGDSKNR